MSTAGALRTRSDSKCELCLTTGRLKVYEVPPTSDGSADQSVLLCGRCRKQIEDPATMDGAHWACLGETMWSQVPAVQVMAWRMLKRLSSEGWAHELLEMLYLEEDTRAWAEALGDEVGDAAGGEAMVHRDAHGAVLSTGDTVTLIKDLVVKGAGFTAKRGTAVRGITLVPDNAGHIEGRVSGQLIVILTEFVKKSG